MINKSTLSLFSVDVANTLLVVNHDKSMCYYFLHYLFVFSHIDYNKLVSRALVYICVREMFGMNVKIDKFTGRNSFSLWQIKMQALLKQQGLWASLAKKPLN